MQSKTTQRGTTNANITVNGPYRKGSKWRLVVRYPAGPDGKRKQDYPSYSSRAAATAARRRLLAEVHAGHLVSDVLPDFERYMASRCQRAHSVREALRGVHRVLGDAVDAPLRSFDERKIRALYLSCTERYAVATHHFSLKKVRTFFRWAIEQGLYVGENPATNVRPIGRQRRGKVQLSMGDARTFYGAAMDDALYGQQSASRPHRESASAVLICFVGGFRKSEVMGLRVRDCEPDGSAVLVAAVGADVGKNDGARRRVLMPEPLRPLIVAQVRRTLERTNGDRDARLFDRNRKWMLDNVRRLCAVANVPEICVQSLRCMHSTIATTRGTTAAIVARDMANGEDINRAHYQAPGAGDTGRAASMLAQLEEQPHIH